MGDFESFDSDAYSAYYPDLSRAFGTDRSKLWNHWTTYGRHEGRIWFGKVLEGASTVAADCDRPLLQVFTTTFREVDRLRELVKFYRSKVPDCLIHVQDNQSRDETEAVAKELGCTFVEFDTGGKLDEESLMNLRNSSWKQSKAHYVLIVDSDEFVNVDEKELRDNLETRVWNVCKCTGYEMFGDSESFDEVFFGCPSAGYCKQVCFLRDDVLHTNYGPGSHTSNFIMKPNVAMKLKELPFELFHAKWASWSSGFGRQSAISKNGRSQRMIAKKWGWQYDLPESQHRQYYLNGVRNSIQVRGFDLPVPPKKPDLRE